MARAQIVITANVSQSTDLDSRPPTKSPMMFLFREILRIKKTSGTATNPLTTAAKIKALIGSKPIKVSAKPITVAPAITP